MGRLKIAVLGAGAWGTALAVQFSHRHTVCLWARDTVQVDKMRHEHENLRYLPGIVLPDILQIDHELDACLAGVDVILIATPVAALRDILTHVAQTTENVPVVWVCKGFEAGSMLLPHQVAASILNPAVPRGVLSGPSFAAEVARGLPTALTLASAEESMRHLAQNFHHHHLRVYTSTDVMGVEIGGAIKNVMAIAAGISDGLVLGHNARAALIARGLAEISRLGQAMGGQAETFMGLTGMGDLILTATGDQSRNRQVGLRLARGEKLPAILRELGHVAEGVGAAREVARLALTWQVDMPIVQAVHRILYHDVSPLLAVADLLNREPHAEVHL